MGEFRFRTPIDWQLPAEVAATIHIVGLDGIPWPCKVKWFDTTLLVSRNREESGRTYIGYQTETFGRLMVCTGSLPAGDNYDLMIELARGTLNRVRNQISNWDEGGLEIAASVHNKIREATQQLGTALMSNNVGQRDDFAKQSLNLTMESIFELSHAFGVQVAGYRRAHAEVEHFWMASSAPLEPTSADGQAEMLTACDGEPFDRVRVSPEQLPLSQEQAVAKPLIVGPFLDASAGGMNQTLIECDDFRARRLYLLNSMRSTLESLPANVQMLQLASV